MRPSLYTPKFLITALACFFATGCASTQSTFQDISTELNLSKPVDSISSAKKSQADRVALASHEAEIGNDDIAPSEQPESEFLNMIGSKIRGTLGADFASIDADDEGFGIDFGAALMIATGENPQVTFANAKIREADAKHQAAKSLWLPSIRAGTSISKHTGRLQNAVGDVIDVDRTSSATGLGTFASGTSPLRVPGIHSSFTMLDALYQPTIAQRTLNARRHDAAAKRNDVLLGTAKAYLDFLKSMQLKSIALQTQAATNELAKLTSTFAEVGQGPQADADRVKTELMARRIEVEKADELSRVATAKLIQQLSIDMHEKLIPVEDSVVPIELITDTENPLSLVETGLRNRHELSSMKELVEAACVSLKKERASPYFPQLTMSMSYGVFGGGQGSDTYGSTSDRFDLDAYAYWNLRNLGFGEIAARREASSKLEQIRAEKARTIDQIVREIREAIAKVETRKGRIEIAKEGIMYAQDAHRRDVERIRLGEGLPIAAQQSLRALDAARRTYLDVVIDFNVAQFELQYAIGWPDGHNLSSIRLDNESTTEE